MAAGYFASLVPPVIPAPSVVFVEIGANHPLSPLLFAVESHDRVPVESFSGGHVINIFAYGSLLCDATIDREHVEVLNRSVAELRGFKRVWGPAVQRDGLSLNPHAIMYTGADEDVVIGALIKTTLESLPYFERREKAYYFSYPLVRVGQDRHRALTFESRVPVAYDVPVYASYAATVACGLVELLGAEEGEREFRRSMLQQYRVIDDVASGPLVYNRWTLLDASQKAVGLALLRRVADI